MKTSETCFENSRLLIFNREEEHRVSVSRMKRSRELAATGTLFWELVSPHKHKLYNFIRKSLNFSEDANDVFQETVLRALRYFRSYKEEKKFNTWLFAIAHNEIKKHYKKVSQHTSFTDMDRLKAPEANDSQELAKEVYQFAESLKPKQREVFFLFYYNGFTISEVSQITKLKPGNIKFHLSQARHSLKKIFGEQNGQ
jgi:RNA polymerase sigma-70 factor (ECF subfamily)